MAFEWMAWAARQEVEHSPTKFVLIALANYADHNGMCFPSAETVKKFTAQSEKTIYRAFKKLEELGLIKSRRKRKENGHLSTFEFQLVSSGQRVQLMDKPVDCESSRAVKAKTPAKAKPETLTEELIEIEPVDCESTPNQSVILNQSDTPLTPLGISQELWEEYRQHRKQLGKKLTPIAQERAIKKLERLKASGTDPTAVIEQTLENGWTGLFELKDRKNEATSRNNPKLTGDQQNDITRRRALAKFGVVDERV